MSGLSFNTFSTGLPTIGDNTGLPTIGGDPGSGLPTDPISSLSQNDNFSKISGLVGSGLAGGVATIKTMGNFKLIGQGMRGVEVPTGVGEEVTKVGGGLGSKIKGIGMGAKQLGSSAVTGAKYGAIIGGAVSALSNGYQVLTGKKTGADAVGTLAADTVTSTISGASGAVAGGLTALGLSALGVGGLPVTILAAGLGLAGAVGTHLLTQKTGLYDSIKNSVKNMMGGNSSTPVN
jgi:hypothetical protein